MSVSRLKHCNEQEIQYLKEVARESSAFSARYLPGSDDGGWARGLLREYGYEPPSAVQPLRMGAGSEKELGRLPVTVLGTDGVAEQG